MPSILNATTTNGLVTSADNSGSLQLQTNNGTTAVTIDTSQNVSIGTTTALHKLTVVDTNPVTGTFKSDSVNGAGIYLDNSGRASGKKFGVLVGNVANGAFSIKDETASADRLIVTSAGVIQAGSTGTGEVFAQNTVKVWGVIQAGATAFYNSFGTSSLSKISTGVFQINFSRTLASSRFGMGGAGYGSAVYVAGGGESTTGTQVRIYNSSGTLIDSDIQFLIAGGS